VRICYHNNAVAAGSDVSKQGNVAGGHARVKFTLHLRRLPLFYVINHIIPCCLLSFVAVLTFILQPSCTDRLGLSTYTLSVYIPRT